jgi:hypothetical protein
MRNFNKTTYSFTVLSQNSRFSPLHTLHILRGLYDKTTDFWSFVLWGQESKICSFVIILLKNDMLWNLLKINFNSALKFVGMDGRDLGGKSRCTSHCWAFTSLDSEVFCAWESTSHRLVRQTDHDTLRIQLEGCCLGAQPHGSPTSLSPLRRRPSMSHPPMPASSSKRIGVRE